MTSTHSPTTMRRIVMLVAVCALPAGLLGVACAQDHDASVVVGSGESFTLDRGNTIHGDLIIVGGEAEVLGRVEGNVVVADGRASLGDTARVDGSALTVRGSLDRASGATVAGDQRKLSAEEFAASMAGIGGSKTPEPEAEGLAEAPAEVPSENGDLDHAPDKFEQRGDLAQFGSPITIPANEIRHGDIVSFGGPVTIKGDVRGDVASFGGLVTISGKVSGDVISFGGPVSLMNGSHVRGDVTHVGGSVHQASDAELDGEVTSLARATTKLRFPSSSPGYVHVSDIPGLSSATTNAISSAFCIIAALITVLVVVACAPRATQITADCIFENPGAAAAHGIITILLFLPMCVLLAITCVGILGIPVLFVGLLLAGALGVVAVKLIFGRQLVGALGWRVHSMLGLAIIGCLLLSLLSLLELVPFVGFIGELLAMCVVVLGVGGAVMTRFGTDPTGRFITSRIGRADRAHAAAPSDAGDDAPVPAETDPNAADADTPSPE